MTENEQMDEDKMLPIFKSLSQGIATTTFLWAIKISRMNPDMNKIKHRELQSFLAVFAGSELMNMSLELEMKHLLSCYQHHGLHPNERQFLSKARHLKIWKCIVAVEPDSDSHGSSPDKWLSGVDNIAEIRKGGFETVACRQYKRMFLNKHSFAVLDNKLIGLKSLTN